MVQQVVVQIQAETSANPDAYMKSLALAAGCLPADISGYYVEKESLDARTRIPMLRQVVQVGIGGVQPQRPLIGFEPRVLRAQGDPVVVVGAGPAGLFAALRLLEAGIKPIVVERGKDVRNRRRDLALLNKTGLVNPESNYCFGEGGAGTYSDGKLYTRSKKRGNVFRILSLLHHFGADERILYEAHPHIGTNKLPQIIVAIREAILAAGGEILFEHKLEQLLIDGGKICGVKLTSGQHISCHQVVLATGHSARDVFTMLHHQGIAIEAKPFALGVRVEHPQALIDRSQYRCTLRPEYLPPAAYSLVEQVNGRGVFSFCMCPGGIIAPAATSPGELVVNGWSPSKRNNPFANSGMVAEVRGEPTETCRSDQCCTGYPKVGG